VTPESALARITAHADPEKAAGMAAYHKVARPYLGVPVPVLDDLARDWRRALDIPARAALACALWDTNIHEARVAAAKLLTQARQRPDDTPSWDAILAWVPQFDGWALADHACAAGAKRLVADPSRLDVVETWTGSDHIWTRRAALVITLPWTIQRDAKPEDLAIRERVLGWAAGYVPDRDWFIQKAIAWWLRDLSRRDPDRVRAFLDIHGAGMKPFARREAARLLPRAATEES
jgi:3-methyladenine DNA glycosylase AlkD